MALDQRLSFVTLGVIDLARARAFCEQHGWVPRSRADDDVVFCQVGGLVVALRDRGRLAEDTAVADSGGWGGIALAHNVRSPDEVDVILQEVTRARGRILRDAAATFRGGYSGMFADLDGQPWEITHNPFWTLDDSGAMLLED